MNPLVEWLALVGEFCEHLVIASAAVVAALVGFLLLS
jgi:hypothetical protein